ncbi:MAG: nuclease-related domain-containing protein [Ilumatobacter sp.]|uniref:nuclease-related domain-containing protein n=1 Tax=Ilumatobacter sp. TaxID=1967498 RepID=UPI00391DAAC9
MPVGWRSTLGARRKRADANGNIDHVVIAPSAIWVIDAKNYSGKVERRLHAGTKRLYVNNRNQTQLVAKMRWQVDAVAKHLAPMGFSSMPVRPVICFTNAEWALLAKPIEIDDVLVTWPRALVAAINDPGGIEADAARAIAVELSSRLPASA